MTIIASLLSFFGGGLAGSVLTFILNRRMNCHLFSLRAQIFPLSNHGKQCLLRFKLLKSFKPVGWIDLAIKVKENTNPECYPSRIGLTCCAKEGSTGFLVFRIENIRKDDFVNILFTPTDEDVKNIRTNYNASELVDYNSSEHLINKIDKAEVYELT